MADLDRQYPWTEGDDLSKVDLRQDELDRYLAVRRSLGPVLQGFENVMRRRNESALGSGTWNIFTAAAGSTNWFRTENSFLQSFSRELERQKMGPRRFENLTNLVEWRFLRRPEALIFGLPDYHRADWIEARFALEGELGPETSEEP